MNYDDGRIETTSKYLELLNIIENNYIELTNGKYEVMIIGDFNTELKTPGYWQKSFQPHFYDFTIRNGLINATQHKEQIVEYTYQTSQTYIDHILLNINNINNYESKIIVKDEKKVIIIQLKLKWK